MQASKPGNDTKGVMKYDLWFDHQHCCNGKKKCIDVAIDFCPDFLRPTFFSYHFSRELCRNWIFVGNHTHVYQTQLKLYDNAFICVGTSYYTANVETGDTTQHLTFPITIDAILFVLQILFEKWRALHQCEIIKWKVNKKTINDVWNGEKILKQAATDRLFSLIKHRQMCRQVCKMWSASRQEG